MLQQQQLQQLQQRSQVYSATTPNWCGTIQQGTAPPTFTELNIGAPPGEPILSSPSSSSSSSPFGQQSGEFVVVSGTEEEVPYTQSEQQSPLSISPLNPSDSRYAWQRGQFTGRSSAGAAVIETTSQLNKVEPEHMIRHSKYVGRRRLGPGETWSGLPVIVTNQPLSNEVPSLGDGGIVAIRSGGCSNVLVKPGVPLRQAVGVVFAPPFVCGCGGSGVGCCAKARARRPESLLVRKMKAAAHLPCHLDYFEGERIDGQFFLDGRRHHHGHHYNERKKWSEHELDDKIAGHVDHKIEHEIEDGRIESYMPQT